MSAHDEPRPTAAASTAERVLLAAVIALLLVMNVLAVANQLGRRLDHDEAEYLHAAWVMDHGKRIYRDFMEDHPPFLFQVLQQMRTESVFDWAVRARIFSALCGTWAMVAAGLIVWRITRCGTAAVLVLGALLGARWTWFRALADIRADAPTLALFMTGFLLMVLEEKPSWRMAWLNGCGIAMAIGAALWNPKWPLVDLCLGAFFLVQGYRLVRARPAHAIAAVTPTIAVVATMTIALISVATIDDYVFFTYELKPHLMDHYKHEPWVAAMFRGLSPLHNAPARFVGALPAAVVLLTVVITIRGWRRFEQDRASPVLLVQSMVVAAAFEVRFLHPWPMLWPQVFLMLSFVVAMAYGLLAASIQRWGSSPLWRHAIVAAALAFALPHLAMMITRPADDPTSAPWDARRRIAETLGPGETVWIGAARHPVTAPDDTYYWYALSDLMPMTIDLVARDPGVRRYLPAMTVESLPICRLARKQEGKLRFIEISAYAEFTPGACACAQIALSRPDLVPTEVTGVYERVPPGTRTLKPSAPPAWDDFVRSKVARCATR